MDLTTSDFILILLLMQIKHFVFDFITQTKYQWSNKGTYMHPGGILHAGLHALGTYWVLVFFTPKLLYLIVVLDFVVHYHIDWLKMNLNTKWNLTPTNSEKFWWLLGADQLAHQLTYLGLLYLVTIK